MYWSRAVTYGHTPRPIRAHTSVVANGVMYVFGGTDNKGGFAKLHTLDLGTSFYLLFVICLYCQLSPQLFCVYVLLYITALQQNPARKSRDQKLLPFFFQEHIKTLILLYFLCSCFFFLKIKNK